MQLRSRIAFSLPSGSSRYLCLILSCFIPIIIHKFHLPSRSDRKLALHGIERDKTYAFTTSTPLKPSIACHRAALKFLGNKSDRKSNELTFAAAPLRTVALDGAHTLIALLALFFP